MRTFEIGKRYKDGAITFEVIARTTKTITVNVIQHAGKFNEKITDMKKAKIQNWGDKEYVNIGCYELLA
jgi:hypothetical protein